MGITPQSIRYYESLGIIKPEKNPISGYRYYSAWDINMLIRARAYRQQGFAMNEVVDIMTDFNLAHTMDALSHKEGELRQEIADRVKLVMNVRDNYRILQDAVSGRSRITFGYRPAMYFLQTQVGYDIIASRKDIIGTWVQRYAAFVLPGGLYKGQGKNDVAYGLFVDDSKLAEVDFDRVPICGVSRAIAGTAGHPCQANATLARPRGQPPPRLSCRRPASPRARTPRSAPAPRASSTRGRARAWR